MLYKGIYTYMGYMGIMEKKMETTIIMGYMGFKVEGLNSLKKGVI